MKSKIDNIEIDDDTILVWRPRSAKGNNRFDCADQYQTSSERLPKGCSQCGKHPQELFDIHSPIDKSSFYLCHNCVMDLYKYLSGKPEGECPVCGFGTLSIKGNAHTCIFGHKWKETMITKKEIIK